MDPETTKLVATALATVVAGLGGAAIGSWTAVRLAAAKDRRDYRKDEVKVVQRVAGSRLAMLQEFLRPPIPGRRSAPAAPRRPCARLQEFLRPPIPGRADEGGDRGPLVARLERLAEQLQERPFYADVAMLVPEDTEFGKAVAALREADKLLILTVFKILDGSILEGRRVDDLKVAQDGIVRALAVVRREAGRYVEGA